MVFGGAYQYNCINLGRACWSFEYNTCLFRTLLYVVAECMVQHVFYTSTANIDPVYELKHQVNLFS